MESRKDLLTANYQNHRNHKLSRRFRRGLGFPLWAAVPPQWPLRPILLPATRATSLPLGDGAWGRASSEERKESAPYASSQTAQRCPAGRLWTRREQPLPPPAGASSPPGRPPKNRRGPGDPAAAIPRPRGGSASAALAKSGASRAGAHWPAMVPNAGRCGRRDDRGRGRAEAAPYIGAGPAAARPWRPRPPLPEESPRRRGRSPRHGLPRRQHVTPASFRADAASCAGGLKTPRAARGKRSLKMLKVLRCANRG